MNRNPHPSHANANFLWKYFNSNHRWKSVLFYSSWVSAFPGSSLYGLGLVFSPSRWLKNIFNEWKMKWSNFDSMSQRKMITVNFRLNGHNICGWHCLILTLKQFTCIFWMAKTWLSTRIDNLKSQKIYRRKNINACTFDWIH